jgi:polar amino acid transport system substrate-binding protein
LVSPTIHQLKLIHPIDAGHRPVSTDFKGEIIVAFPASPTRRLGGALLALAVGGALALTGCSSASPEAAPADSGSSAAVAPPAILTADMLKVCTGDSPPNIYYDDDNNLIGVEIDLANAFATELGLKVTLEEYAFAGLIPALQANQCDVIMGSLYIKPEREEIANFVPYLYSGTAVATAKDNPKNVTGYDDTLCGVRLVAINGASGAAKAEEKSEECKSAGKPGIEITIVDEGVNAVQQVLAGQVDAFMDTSEIVGFYSKQSDGDFVMVGEPFGKMRIGAATLKDNTELNEALDAAFQTMIDNGTYEQILADWSVEANNITLGE